MIEQPFSAVECWIDETRTVWKTADSGMTHYVRGDFHNDLAAEVALLRAQLAERDAELEKYRAELRVRYGTELAIARKEFAAEQPRTDAEWKAADRRKRIFDKTIEAAILIHAARFAALDSATYAGHVSAGSVSHRIGPMREASIAEAREIAAAVVEAEE